MKFKRYLLWFWLVGFSVISTGSLAVEQEPLNLLKTVSNQMLQELDKHIGRIKNNPRLVHSLVNRILVPHFDLTRMSKSVVGRYYWQQASPQTHRQFIQEFTRYIVNTYSSALQSYDGETMRFYPLRQEGKDRVRVSSDLMVKNGSPIQIQYGLIKHRHRWLIYDFSVDGVSIIKNYSAQFAGIIRQKGLDGLVSELKKRNTNQ